MLEIVSLTDNERADDLILAFAGRDVVVSLRRPPDEFWTRAELERDFGAPRYAVAIGQWQGRPCYAVQVDPQGVDPLQHLQGSLYTLLGRISDATFAAYGRGFQLLSWQRDHRFCGRCGASTALADGGKAMACSQCEFSCYPRLSPCVIVAVTRGDQLLLAAAAGRRANFYSTLAGFIEPGESAEEAVAREVREEVGIEVDNIRYFQSQPWPFPSQLMLGFYADYAGGEFKLDLEEIEDAGWFTRDNMPPTPPAASISGQLIQGFLAGRS